MPPAALNNFTHIAPLYCTCNKVVHPPIVYLSCLVDIDTIKKSVHDLINVYMFISPTNTLYPSLKICLDIPKLTQGSQSMTKNI